jgi:hypothetical protein
MAIANQGSANPPGSAADVREGFDALADSILLEDDGPSEEVPTPAAEAYAEEEETTSDEDVEAAPEAEAEPEAEETEAVEAADTDDEAEPTTDEEYIEFEANGESVRVTPDEYRLGYLRQQDFTQKTQSLSDSRRQLETERQHIVQMRDQAHQEFEAYRVEQLRQIASLQEPEPDWAARAEEDPIGVFQEKMAWEAQQAERQSQMRAQHQQHLAVMQQQQAAQAQMQEQHLAQQRERMLDTIPEWRDPKKATAEMGALRDFAMESGYSPEEVDGITDSRAVKLLRDAYAFRQLKAAQPETRKKVVAKPKTVRPSTPKPSKSVADKRFAAKSRKLAETGDVRDAAKLFFEYLED